MTSRTPLKHRRAMGAVALLALSACTPSAPISQAPVAMAFAQARVASTVLSLETITIRTRVRRDQSRAELARVPCDITGPGYSARFVTPAAIQLPVFKGRAPTVSLSCRYDGEVKTTKISARNLSQEARDKQREDFLEKVRGSGNGLSLSLNIDLSTRPRTNDTFAYADAVLTFRR